MDKDNFIDVLEEGLNDEEYTMHGVESNSLILIYFSLVYETSKNARNL
jgi:hypothetical protein